MKRPATTLATTVVALAAIVVLHGMRATAEGQPPAPAQAGPPAQPGQGRASAPAPDPTKPQVLTLTTGTRARYRVTEQLAGISFPNDAVGSTDAISGAIVLNPDCSFGATSKIDVDLTTLSTDQAMRDGYVRRNTLEVEKFPTLTIVPTRANGLKMPLPSGMGAQAGFQLVTNMTLHGVTKEIVWTTIATFGNDTVSGSAKTTIDFATFNLTKPSLARLVSVDDKIHLEIEFRASRRGQ
jgi:polyisoprenoid-binding protein YceI